MNEYININLKNIDNEHLCCAIGDKKHFEGVLKKKEWIKENLSKGLVFRKLNAQGKIFIEYAPLENAYVPIDGDDYIYIYCLWVAGSYKGHGYGKELLEYCINDAKEKGKKGICVISSKKKKPFLSEKDFFIHYGFKVVDKIDDFELLALSFTDSLPEFNEYCKKMSIEDPTFTIYYNRQCPYINNSINEIKTYSSNNNIKINLIEIDTLEKAKHVPCVFNNWAIFKDGKFVSNTILNENSFRKLIEK